jgi:hypothetical protein
LVAPSLKRFNLFDEAKVKGKVVRAFFLKLNITP